MRLNRETIPFVVEGLPFFLPAALIPVLFGAWWNVYFFFPSLAVTVFLCSFFRNPRRRIPQGKGLILSPADWRIVVVKKRQQGTQVSIFMSVFNCHVNRAPLAGTIKEIRYQPGRFLPADRGEESLMNEHNAFRLQTLEGPTVRFVQVAGILARRIVRYARAGDRVHTGWI